MRKLQRNDLKLILMRNIFTLIAFAMMPMLATAQTYFKDGTTWKTRLGSTLSADNTIYYNTYAKLNGTETVDGYQALKLFYYEEAESEPQLYAYIRTDDDKVYFKPANAAKDTWYLMYDFGLKVGESCEVYSAWNIDNYPNLTESSIKCLDIQKDENSGFAKMLLKEYYEGFDCGTFVWYKGLSSELGLLWNNGCGVDGIGRKLMEVSYNGDVIYSDNTTNVENVSTGGLKTSVSGKNVTITNISKPERVELFSADGKLVKELVVGKETANIILPANGIYILKIGGQTTKIVAGN